jgi:hypothetical protein
MWISELHRVIGVVTHLPCLQSMGGRLVGGLGPVREQHRPAISTFDSLLPSVEEGLLDRAYSVVEHTLDVVNGYVSKWLAFQALWDLNAGKVEESLGDDVQRWQQMLKDIDSAQATLDTSSFRRFGPITVQFGTVREPTRPPHFALRAFCLCT